MAKLYTINPMILSESLPRYASPAGVISDYFYLFNIYSTNPYIVRSYMDFIDNEFNSVFRKLKYQIVCYEYPDKYEIPEYALNYINKTYNLEKDMKLDSGNELKIFNVYDFYRDKNVSIYLNEYVLCDATYFGNGIFDDEMSILDSLCSKLPYLRDRVLKDTIKLLIYRYYDYNSVFVDYVLQNEDVFNSNMINEPVFILAQLKAFVKWTVKERETYEDLSI